MMGTRRAILYLIAIFVLGVVVGLLGERLIERRWGREHESWKERRAKVVDRFSRELNLTPEQRDQLARILDETGQRYQTLHEQVRNQYNEIRQSGRQRIREILTPEQRTRFEEIAKKLDEERRRYERRR